MNMLIKALLLLCYLCCSEVLLVNGLPEEGYSLRLIGGCAGTLQIQRPEEEWTDVHPFWFSLELGNRVCLELNCGTALSVERKDLKTRQKVVRLEGFCANSSLSHCFKSGIYVSDEVLQLNCSDSVRLVSGENMCSGSLQILDQSLKPSWGPVCEGALDRSGAEVVCRQLGCGAPVLHGELSSQGQMFYCKGNEMSLLDCPRTCPGPPLNLTCTEPLRLTGGASRCEGTAEVEYRGEWRRILSFDTGPWDLRAANTVCRILDCGKAVSTEERQGVDVRNVWLLRSDCVRETSSVRDCVFAGSNTPGGHDMDVKVVCSGKD